MNQKASSSNRQPKTDFENDLISELQRVFRSWGVRWSKDANLQDLLRDYFTLFFKLIEPKQRKVKFSNHLLTKLEGHPKQKEVLHLQNLMEHGANANGFLSKKVLQTNFHDHLCNEWHIYHFHLSLKVDKRTGFIKQVNDLLFIYITDEQALFLDVDKHREGIFGDIKWLEILHDDFPDVMKQFESHWSDVSPDPSAKDRQLLWDKGYTLGATKVRGKVYFSPGIGRATSGHSMMVGKNSDAVFRWLWHITEQFETSYELICEKLSVKPDKAKFALQFGERTFEIVERTTKTLVLEYPEVVDI